MGHLINPIAFRLGINKSWESIWYIKNIYYPEFIHDILNLRNFIYYIFLSRDSIESGILLSEIKFFKFFKKYIVKIFLYHLELEKISYKLMNNIYVNYYKKLKTKSYKLLPDFWFLHNADLYAFIFLFYNIFFKKFKKLKKKKKIRRTIELDMDKDIIDIINKFNGMIISNIKSKNYITNNMDLYIKNLENKLQKSVNLYDLIDFRIEMQKAENKYGKNFRYNFHKENLILNSLKKKIKFKLKSLKKKFKLSNKLFYKIFYTYLIGNLKDFKILVGNLKSKKKTYHKSIKYIFKKIKKKNHRKDMLSTMWSRDLKTDNFDFDNNLESSENILNQYFLNIFLYLGRKVDFRKFKNYELFSKKWGYLIKFLKLFDTFKFKSKMKSSNFFLFLSLCLYSNLKSIRLKKKFYVRNLIYRILYVWLGKTYFFPFFKFFSKLLNQAFLNLSKFKDIKFNYNIISVDEVSARFLATYISLKLRKNHYVQAIINPVKRELWRLSRSSLKKKKLYKKIIKKFLRHKKKRFIQLLMHILNIYNRILYLNLKKNFSLITLDIFKFKLNIFKDIVYENFYKNINKFIKIYFFFSFFYGKLQNNLNFKLLNFKNFKNLKGKKQIFYYYFTQFNNFIYLNIKKFRVINVSHLLIQSNIIKNFLDFSFFRYLWIGIAKFNKRNGRKNYNLYKISSLIAFKMALKGRFSRRQRASSIWYTHGRASLNRLNVKIDYAFVKVPLKNSIVSIKIWLFRKNAFNKFKYILNF